jgi:hypothetical protein
MRDARILGSVVNESDRGLDDLHYHDCAGGLGRPWLVQQKPEATRDAGETIRVISIYNDDGLTPDV